MRLLIVTVGLLTACSGQEGEPAVDEPALDYSLPGAYTPGTSSTTINGTDSIELKVETWFPSSEEGGALVSHDGFYGANAYTNVSPDCINNECVASYKLQVSSQK